MELFPRHPVIRDLEHLAGTGQENGLDGVLQQGKPVGDGAALRPGVLVVEVPSLHHASSRDAAPVFFSIILGFLPS
jgi:hypothetical protein